jgi:hypothetical protein
MSEATAGIAAAPERHLAVELATHDLGGECRQQGSGGGAR